MVRRVLVGTLVSSDLVGRLLPLFSVWLLLWRSSSSGGLVLFRLGLVCGLYGGVSVRGQRRSSMVLQSNSGWFSQFWVVASWLGLAGFSAMFQ